MSLVRRVSCAAALALVAVLVPPSATAAATTTSTDSTTLPDRFTLTPDPLELGAVEAGQTATGTATVTNTGDRPLSISMLSSNGGFNLSNQNCFGDALAPGGTCTIAMTYTSSTVGNATGTLGVQSGGGVVRQASLTAWVTPPPPDQFTIEPAPVDFGTVTTGDSAIRPATVTNTGTRPLDVSAVRVTGDGFSVDASTCTGELSPAGQCAVQLRYTAGDPGTATGLLTVVSGDGTEQRVDLTGVSNAVPVVEITSAPPPLIGESTAQVTFDVADDGATTTTCSLDGAEPVPCSSPHIMDGLADGPHRLLVTATDEHGATASDGTTWTVDTTAPVLSLPETTVVDATSPSGVPVEYVATAEDAIDRAPSVACAPASGTTFAIRTTTVTCTAGDTAGNSSTGTFDVVVLGALEQVLNLREAVLAEVPPGDLRDTLVGQLDDAEKALRDGEKPCGPLQGFVKQVRAQSGKKLTADQARRYETSATRIATVAGC